MQDDTNKIASFLLIVTFLILLMAGFILTILFLYRKKQVAYYKNLQDIKSDYEQTLLKTQLEIQEETFQTLSREIHDNINLSLTLAKLNLNTLDLTKSAQSYEKINASIEFVSKAINDLTDISRSMNSEIIAERGLISALEQEIDKLRKLNWFEISFILNGDPVFMDAQKELFVFRIVQEAFNNILKHAHANRVILDLSYFKDRINIIISDDGVGFLNKSPELGDSPKPTAGLRNIKKRAQLLNGQCFINSHPGGGTEIKIEIPFIE